jgi:prolyl-tRNA synthetase
VLINQWANVMRWEKRTRPFLRTLEFLWQEGHTAHETEDEAAREVAQMLGVYREVAEDIVAVPVYLGEKSATERFAGATHTYSIEALMPDGKALQAGTSHELGQNFARAYGIEFSGRDQTQQFAWTTSWGMSWRMLGAMIMVHGDDTGLRIPPKMAPIEVVIVPLASKGGVDTTAFAHELAGQLRGVPLRIVVGERDLAAGQVTLVRRDVPLADKAGRERAVPVGELAPVIRTLLDEIQASMLLEAREFLISHTVVPATHDEFIAMCKERGGMIDIPWCDRAACEAAVKDETSATTRNLRPEPQGPVCLACGEPAKVQAYFAQSCSTPRRASVPVRPADARCSGRPDRTGRRRLPSPPRSWPSRCPRSCSRCAATAQASTAFAASSSQASNSITHSIVPPFSPKCARSSQVPSRPRRSKKSTSGRPFRSTPDGVPSSAATLRGRPRRPCSP